MSSVLRFLHRLEDGFLALLLASMIGLAVLQILLRNFGASSLIWIDPLLRIEVLWLGLLGAAAAARSGRHITIDVLEPVLRDPTKARLLRLANLAAAVICALVAWYSLQFVLLEMQYPTSAVLGFSTWHFQTVIPFSFALMATRFLLRVFKPAAPRELTS